MRIWKNENMFATIVSSADEMTADCEDMAAWDYCPKCERERHPFTGEFQHYDTCSQYLSSVFYGKK